MPSPLVEITRKLARRADALPFDEPVDRIYNPLVYARRPHEIYLERFAQPSKEALFLGMNPGPFGMAQTGVPFGEIAAVRDWMGIDAKVDSPPNEHPKRPIQGFDCKRSEVSGRRLWGWVAERWGSPEDFFSRFFVHNYCPLVFMGDTGKNVTPDKLKASERDGLFAICDEALREIVTALSPRLVVGVGAFAEKRARTALADFDIEFGRLLHPSPASPLANKGWAEQADRCLTALDLA